MKNVKKIKTYITKRADSLMRKENGRYFSCVKRIGWFQSEDQYADMTMQIIEELQEKKLI
jgi:hypothetical protein